MVRKGRTRAVLVAVIDGSLRVQLLAMDVVAAAEAMARGTKTALRQTHGGVMADAIAINQRGQAYMFDRERGRVLQPLLRMARQAGYVDLDSLIEKHQVIIAPLMLPTRGKGAELELDLPPLPWLGEARLLPPLPYGLVRGCDGLSQGDLNRHVRRGHTSGQRSEREVQSNILVRQLAGPAPQRLPDALLEGGRFRCAWIVPEALYVGIPVEESNLVALRLIGLHHDGSLEMSVLVTSYELHGLKEALQAKTGGPFDVDRIVFSFEDLDEEELALSRGGLPHGVHDAVTQHVEEQLKTVTREIYSELEPGLRDEFASIDAYNLLQSGADPERARVRRQMVASIWGGAELLLTRSKAGQELLAAVDTEEQLHARAAKVARVEPWVVKRITRMPREAIGALTSRSDPNRGFVELARTLQHLGAHVQIRSAADARAISNIIWRLRGLWGEGPDRKTGLAIIGRSIARTSIERVQGLAMGGGLEDAVAGRNGWRGLADWARFVDDCIEIAGIRHVNYNLDPLPPLTRAARAVITAEMTIEDALRWSDRYHQFVAQVPLASYGDEHAAPPPLLDQIELPVSGWSARQLRTQEELAREGREMVHCVQSYSDNVQRRTSVIFSLASPTGDDRVTLELRAGYLHGWELLQASGRINEEVKPGSAAHAAIDEFMDVLEAATAAITPEVLARYRRPDRSRKSGMAFMSSLIETYGSHAWRMVRGMLPGSAHGRIESKYEAVFKRVNEGALDKAQQRQRRVDAGMESYADWMQGRR